MKRRTAESSIYLTVAARMRYKFDIEVACRITELSTCSDRSVKRADDRASNL